MAKITASVYTSHIPAIGVAWDLKKTAEDYWKPVFAGYEYSKQWQKGNKPDVIILVYNDHTNNFGFDLIPTFALGMNEEFIPCDEGWGPRPIPNVPGDQAFASHLAHSVIEQGFDLTLCYELGVDHGLTVPLSLMFGDVDPWPVKVIPLHVNVVQYPVPSGQRCYDLGRAIRNAVAAYDEDINVHIWGTGGMSHQLQGPRAGLINKEWDNQFLDDLIADPKTLAKKPHVEYVREAGSEGIELVMWLIARAAMCEEGQQPVVKHRFYHVPASNTAVGHLILEAPSSE